MSRTQGNLLLGWLLALAVLAVAASLVAADRPSSPSEEEVVAGFIKALSDRNPLVRKHAALALGEMGPKAKAAVADLRKALLDGDERVRGAAAQALDGIVQPEPKGKDDEGRPRDRELAELRDKAIRAEIEAKTLQERNAQLLEQLETLTKEMHRLKAGAGPRPDKVEKPRKNPPIDAVQGQIKAIDEKSGLVTVSIGADAGVRRDHTLEIYRLKPKPEYLGTLRILDVRPTEAIGKMVPGSKGKPEVGDQVASRITGEKD